MSKVCPVSVNVKQINVLSNLRAKITNKKSVKAKCCYAKIIYTFHTIKNRNENGFPFCALFEYRCPKIYPLYKKKNNVAAFHKYFRRQKNHVKH